MVVVVVVRGGGVWISARLGRREWVSVESDCVECERDGKQREEDRMTKRGDRESD